MDNPRTSQNGELLLKPSGGRKMLPYGMSDDPHANEVKSPCLEHPDYEIPTPCPVLVRRVKLAKRTVHNRSALPPECKACELRLAYADGTDPSRQRCKPNGDHAAILKNAPGSSRYGETTGKGYEARIEHQARLNGYIDAKTAITILRGLGHSWRKISETLKVSQSGLLRVVKRKGYA